jgi:DNA-binding NarL/FixJ family response regulator
MPEMNGIQACRLITSQHSGLKVVVASVHNDPTIVQAAFKAGASAYVWKPFVDSELIPAIKNVLAGQRYRSSGLRQS